MILKRPYGFLIKNFKFIHAILLLLYIYLAFKLNGMYTYLNKFAKGSGSRLDALNYVNNNYIYVIFISIVICVVIYALMRYKKKPRFLYIILIIISLCIGVMIGSSYSAFNTIYMSSIDSKTLLLYRDLLLIFNFISYYPIVVTVIRALGFDIKKFNFSSDLQELGLELSDEEEVELEFGSTDGFFRKIRRNIRELRYYYIENKFLINILIVGVVIFMMMGIGVDKQIVNKVYKENEVFSYDNISVNITNTYITDYSYSNKYIGSDNNSFVVLKFNISANNISINTSNMILVIDNDSYVANAKYGSYFSDIGLVYDGNKINGNYSKILIYSVPRENLGKKMKFVFFGDKEVFLNPINLDEDIKASKYKVNDKLDFGNSILGSGSLSISSFDIKDVFEYEYQYNVNGNDYTSKYSINSSGKVILNLKMVESNPLNLTMFDFFNRYVRIRYTVNGEEKTVSSYYDKTPGDYKDGLFIAVNKDIMEASNISLLVSIRDKKYIYVLK